MSFPVIDGTEVVQDPPAGYQVNFENPMKDWATINSSYIAFIIEFTVAFLLLCQRLYSAIFILRKFLIDDCGSEIHLRRPTRSGTDTDMWNRHDHTRLGMK